nr:zinc finger, CCHC-type [Tanacetum cinerariifolium]
MVISLADGEDNGGGSGWGHMILAKVAAKLNGSDYKCETVKFGGATIGVTAKFEKKKSHNVERSETRETSEPSFVRRLLHSRGKMGVAGSLIVGFLRNLSRRLQGRFLGLQVKITWATRFLKFSCKETDRFSLGYRKSFLLSQASWSFGFELQRLNIEKLDGNIVQMDKGSKQVGFKQLGPDVETRVHEVSSDDTAVAQRWLEDKQPEEKTNTNCLRSKQQCMISVVAKHLGVALIQQQNGLVDDINMTLFAKFLIHGSALETGLLDFSAFRFVNDNVAAGGYRQVKVLKFFDCTGSLQGFLGLINTRLNIEKLDGNIVQMDKGDREAEVFQVSSDDTAVAQRWLEDKQPEEKTNINCLRSKQQCMNSVVAKHLGVALIQQQNVSVDDINMTLFAKVLHGFEYEMEPLWDHTFEVEPQENVDQGVGLQEVQTQDFMDYQLACDRDQHLACKLCGYREDIACEVIFKWKVGLKNDMDARQMCMFSATVARNAMTTTTTITGSMHQ